jgi:hypothetical protein
MCGCTTTSSSRSFLQLSEDNLAKRQLQIRQYDTHDEIKIMQATASVLQDLGFNLTDSETDLGLIVASKKADAQNKGAVIMASIADAINAANGTPTNALAQQDEVQDVRASVIIKTSLDATKIIVRITFQRIVWSFAGQVNKAETMSDPTLYQKFFDSLSKSIFLEANNI